MIPQDTLAAILRDVIAPESPKRTYRIQQDDEVKTCCKCGVELTDDNWTKSLRTRKIYDKLRPDYICSPCHMRRQWRILSKHVDFDELAGALLERLAAQRGKMELADFIKMRNALRATGVANPGPQQFVLGAPHHRFLTVEEFLELSAQADGE